MSKKESFFEDDPLWYKDAVIYEFYVKTFFDSNNDGIGDFKGLIRKLDYLQDLGITAIWILPFYPSPLRDDGYNIADYFNRISLRQEDAPELEPWLDPWYKCVGRTFLEAYVKTAGNAGFVPADSGDLEILLQVFLLEKAVYELGYELNNRPDWLVISFREISSILGGKAE